MGRLLGEQPGHESADRLRHLGIDLAGQRRILLHDIAQNAADIGSRERLHAGQHLVHHHANGEKIGLRGDCVALDLLGRHVVRSAQHRSDGGEVGVDGTSDPEVCDLRLPLG